MTWISKYRVKAYIGSCLWIGPAMAVVAGVAALRLVLQVDLWTQWRPLAYGQDGAAL